MLLAAVDLGSNSFRLELGRVEGSMIERHGYWKETVRLAAGLGDDGRLSKRAIETACECLARMNERLRGMKSEQVRAVGTQALRQARNASDFLLEAQHALGYPIEIIAGREEARLVFEGCMHTLPLSDKRRLVVDIGGASTEVIIGRGFAAERAESFKMGCVVSSLRYFKDGKIDRASFKKAQVAASAELEEAIDSFSRAHWDEAYGSSGTVGAVSEILRAEGWSDGTITSEGLLKLKHGLISATEIKRVKFAGLKPDRQEVIAGGVAVLAGVFETLGVAEMRPARGALRVGVLYDLLGRRESRDIRDATVDRLMTRFAVDHAQAERVGRFARAALSQLVPKIDEDAAKRLGWATQLHEMGFAISHNDYHKHGAYLVEHADLAGFSTDEQKRVALLVLGQRGNLRKVSPALEEPERIVKVLALRLAVIMAHARRDVDVPTWSVKLTRGAIEFALDGDWLARHPLTLHLLEEEAEQWAKVGIKMNIRAG